MRCSLAFRLGGFLALVLLAGLVALPTSSQGQAAKKGKKYALLVGVNTYEHEDLKALKYTENDVEQLAKLLLDPSAGCFASVRVLTMSRGKKDPGDLPTAKNIREALAKLNRDAKRHDLILVGFSGHGVELSVSDPDKEGPDKTYHYFCPTDANLENVSYSTGKHDKLILLEKEVFIRAGGNDSPQKIVLVDACRNEFDARGAARSFYFPKDRQVPEGLGVLLSCRSGQKSWETDRLAKGHGVFFYHVLEGLKGKAKNTKNEITWTSLLSYIEAEITDEYMQKLIGSGARQVPHSFGNIVGALPLIRFDGKTPDEPITKLAPDKGKEITNSIGMKLALIQKGEFTMGSPKDEKDHDKDEEQRSVTIPKAFYMGVYEVTQEEYLKVMGENPSYFTPLAKIKAQVGKDTSKFPVENVTCLQAKEFCDKLTALAKEKGRVYRLPTEAEWEYACRAGTKSATHYGDTLSSKQANFDGTYPYNGADKGPYLGRTAPVGSYKPNAWGLHDMHGNVWEWCDDKYSPKTDSRVIRGGSWDERGLNLRSAGREPLVKASLNNHTGFRVVCEPRLP